LVETFHCTVGVGVPLAPAVKVAVAPFAVLTFVGCTLIAGAEFEGEGVVFGLGFATGFGAGVDATESGGLAGVATAADFAATLTVIGADFTDLDFPVTASRN
jgi:hypothetical protein